MGLTLQWVQDTKVHLGSVHLSWPQFTPMSWPQFTLRPEVLVRVRQLNTKAFKLPFMSKLLFLSKPCTCSLTSLDTESTTFIGKF